MGTNITRRNFLKTTAVTGAGLAISSVLPGKILAQQNQTAQGDLQLSSIKTLLFTGGEIHDHKGCGVEIEKHLAAAGNFDVTYIEEDLNVFTDPGLSQYDLIVFYYTIGSITDEQYTGLSNFIKSGKGFVPIHSGADSFRDSEEYRALVGGHFVTHPHYRSYQVSILNREHPITQGLDEFMITDEQYIVSYDARVNILANALYQGVPHPVAWTKPWGSGRVYYLALGHDPAACAQEHFGTMLTRGASWAATG